MSNVRQLRSTAAHDQAARFFAIRDFLMTRTGWTVQGTITHNIGVSGVQMRQVCQAYPRSFVSSTEGYKYVLNATSAEIKHSVQVLLQRAEKITARARALTGRI